MTDEITSLTLRLPQELRDRLKARAAQEERTESQFVRFHLSRILETNPAKQQSKNIARPA